LIIAQLIERPQNMRDDHITCLHSATPQRTCRSARLMLENGY